MENHTINRSIGLPGYLIAHSEYDGVGVIAEAEEIDNGIEGKMKVVMIPRAASAKTEPEVVRKLQIKTYDSTADLRKAVDKVIEHEDHKGFRMLLIDAHRYLMGERMRELLSEITDREPDPDTGRIDTTRTEISELLEPLVDEYVPGNSNASLKSRAKLEEVVNRLGFLYINNQNLGIIR